MPLDKADVAIILAALSAIFSGWQAYAAYQSARLARSAAERRAPVFEISSSPSERYDGWTSVRITARNVEPVEVRITGYKYRGRVLIANPDNFPQRRDADGQITRHGNAETIARHGYVTAGRSLGAAGEQRIASMAPNISQPTAYLNVLVKGAFEPKRLKVEWQWADDLAKC